jgi:hypothetical protein
MEGTRHGLVEELSRSFPAATEENREDLRIDVVPVQILTEQLPKTTLMRYCYAQASPPPPVITLW